MTQQFTNYARVFIFIARSLEMDISKQNGFQKCFLEINKYLSTLDYKGSQQRGKLIRLAVQFAQSHNKFDRCTIIVNSRGGLSEVCIDYPSERARLKTIQNANFMPILTFLHGVEINETKYSC